MFFKWKIITPILKRKNTFLLLGVLQSMAYAGAQEVTPGVNQQIEKSVRQKAEDEIKAAALHQGWGKYTLHMEPVIPPQAALLAECPDELIVRSPAVSKRTLYRLRYDITCSGMQNVSVAVAVKNTITLPVVVATHMLERGRIIDVQDVELHPQDIALLNGQFFTAVEDTLGQTVKRRIAVSKTLSTGQLELPVIVERGQSVLMLAGQQGVEASTSGEALRSGRKGEIIRVRNSSSQRVIDAIITSPGVVRIVAAPH